MNDLSWDEFERVEIRVGTILTAEPLPKARVPAYILTIDFGEPVGIRKSSARITALYSPEELIGRQIVGVVNFPPKQIGSIKSQCLVTGFYREDGVVLAVPDKPVPNGLRLG
ncbi:tRNA-binding protein [Desulfovibrio inopinatus]|uniref:tRNA-binding protein n=1 Tax=Desulfovibrio inopinatus TaxID=102109 RepID=UPI000400D712|nr:tRNA-binding protein [Desulfovibrio inopinatus]